MAEARRVVITGMGVVSCLGNSKTAVGDALRPTKGITLELAGQDVTLDAGYSH